MLATMPHSENQVVNIRDTRHVTKPECTRDLRSLLWIVYHLEHRRVDSSAALEGTGALVVGTAVEPIVLALGETYPT